MSRREFTPTQRREIVTRSKNADGFICCEGCGQVLGAKPYEIDHIIPEGLRPEVDKQRKITIVEGQLLGKDCCHRGENGKTKKDQKQIAKSNRQFDKSQGLKRQKQKIPTNNSLRTRQPKKAVVYRPVTFYREETP
ncbi:hypothetical protein [Rhizobium sp. Root651]|uniref:hypothetical protein n=1 Tax=Rhizobium sp. Root651 TaxID=1736577 RepID=UPI0007128C7F|nr:hypothetical protein [Rhizobium sp. Root651]KRA63075.1 hypothetical protein ASD85_06380 [Rhizobium sp. Root651]